MSAAHAILPAKSDRLSLVANLSLRIHRPVLEFALGASNWREVHPLCPLPGCGRDNLSRGKEDMIVTPCNYCGDTATNCGVIMRLLVGHMHGVWWAVMM
jgi:hypothetical protein